jgi:hypothetical protein
MTLAITFTEPKDVTDPGLDGWKYSFPFSIVDSALIGAPEQRSQTHHHRLIVKVSRNRVVGWGISDVDLPKILFEFGKRRITELVQSNSLPEAEAIRLMINTSSHPEPECPFDASAIPSPNGHTFKVERAKGRIGFSP